MSVYGTGTYGSFSFGLGTNYPLTDLVGWEDLPGVRTSDESLASAHGVLTGPDWADGRIITLSLGVRGDTPADLQTKIAAARAAFPIGSTQTLTVNGETVQAKVRKRSIPQDLMGGWRIGSAIVECS